jgi:WD40 repeat protein
MIWDAATGTCVQTLEGHNNSVTSVAFSADGQWVASGSNDKTVMIWDAATGTCVQTLKGHNNSVTSVAFSADGQQVVSGSGDETVKIWDAVTGACMQTFDGHNNSVDLIAFSADGQRVASGSNDKTVKIWDAATGTCVQTLKGHNNSVNLVAFSADGQWVASGSNDKTVKIWDVAMDTCVQTLRVGRVINYLLFDPRTNSLLSTDIGLLNLDLPVLPPAINNGSIDATLQSVRHSGWGISTDSVWITKDGKGMLWLPPEYRVMKSAVVGPTVAIGCRSGRVLVMKFS